MKKFIVVLLAVMALFLTACTNSNSEFDGLTEDQKANEIVQAFVAYMETSEGKQIISANGGIVETSASDESWDDVKGDYPIVDEDNSDVTVKFGGSTSVEKVAKALSASFTSLAGDFVANHNHTGSGDAYLRVQGDEKDGANKLHIGFASRNFKDTEQGVAGTFGQLAWDAVVAVVAESRAISNITDAQLVDIYDGTITDWNDLESAGSEVINAYTRDTTSGTREAFFKGIDFDDAVDSNQVLVGTVVEVAGNGEMVTAVENDVHGIGYISLSTLADADLKGLSFDGVEPTIANVLNNTYGLKRPFMYMTRDYNSENTIETGIDAAILEKSAV